jgi:hypothetical protein
LVGCGWTERELVGKEEREVKVEGDEKEGRRGTGVRNL